MIYEEIKTPFRVYNIIRKQDRFLKGNNPSIFQLISFRDTLLPFQFRFESSEDISVSAWKIRNLNGAVMLDITDKVSSLEKVRTPDGFGYIIFKGGSLNIFIPEGVYYFEMTVDGESYFSEVFTVLCDSPVWGEINRFLQIEWDNDGTDLGPVIYQTGYKNILLLDTGISREEPTIEIEGEEDGFNNFHPTSQKYVDNLSISELVPFYLGEALLLMTMHRKVLVTLPDLIYEGRVKNITPTLAQNEQSGMYQFSAKFQQETVYYQSGCNNNINIIL